MAGARPQRLSWLQGQKHVQAQKFAGIRRLVVKYERRLPLIRHGVVESAIAIYIRHRDPSSHHGFPEPYLVGDVLEPAAPVAHEKRLRVVAADIVSRLEARPETRVGHKLVVSGAKRLQFRPAVDLALDETGRLDGLRKAVIVEIRQAGVPSPSASGQPQRLARLHVGGKTVPHALHLARTEPKEM